MAQSNIISPNRVIKHVSIQSADLGKGATAPTPVIIGNYNGWEYDIGDDSVLDIEMPHSVANGISAGFHIVWVTNEAYAANNGEIQWQINYSAIAYDDESEAIDAPSRTGILTTGDINISALAKAPIHTTSLIIPANHINFSYLLGATLSRIAINDGNDPVADPAIIAVHVDFTSDKRGT